jgi:protein-tyrosine phosphatase
VTVGVPPGPIPDSYWVERGRLLAGRHPGVSDEAAAVETLAAIRAAGVDSFLDLTEAGEYSVRPYEADLAGLEYRRMSVRDLGCPSRDEMREILDAIDGALAAGRTLYVHCYGGIGRTGTVVGCWLVRHGTPPRDALALIAERRRDTPSGYRSSPETGEQREFVLGWSEGE